MKKKFLILIFSLVFSITNKTVFAEDIYDLTGVWQGINRSFSIEKGHRTWKKEITIFEQKERIFKGYFKYADGVKNFLGVLRLNNKNFYWVSSESKGYIHGEIINNNTIEVCYTEAHKGAAVGCAILKKIKEIK